MGRGRDEDGVHDGKASVALVLTGREGLSVCGGARTTSSNRKVGGGRRAASSNRKAAVRERAFMVYRHSRMSRTRCVEGVALPL